MLVLSAGLLAIVFPSLTWHRNLELDGRMLPQFFFGLIALIVLFNIYIVSQKRTVNATRHELIRELVFSEQMESLSMLDPVTQLLNQRGVDQALTHEVARANRLGTDLSLMILKINTLPVVRGRYGTVAGDKFIAEVAKLLKGIFRGSDIIARFGGDEFLAILPNTSERQAECARRRIQEAIDSWNLSTKTGCEISASYGIVAYVTGCDPTDLLRTAQRKAITNKQSVMPVLVPFEAFTGSTSRVLV
ncbi:MAG TPA: GGDEF domain-containing protein [Terriglobales bacterium]|nr:GGDEF domain-containing protein [Terriglobales bacterium]